MSKKNVYLLTLPLLLIACQSVPLETVGVCPQIPALDQAQVAQEPTFSERMRLFLLGKPLEQTNYSLTSSSAKTPTPKLGQQPLR